LTELKALQQARSDMSDRINQRRTALDEIREALGKIEDETAEALVSGLDTVALQARVVDLEAVASRINREIVLLETRSADALEPHCRAVMAKVPEKLDAIRGRYGESVEAARQSFTAYLDQVDAVAAIAAEANAVLVAQSVARELCPAIKEAYGFGMARFDHIEAEERRKHNVR
jgi:hypothetical protein